MAGSAERTLSWAWANVTSSKPLTTLGIGTRLQAMAGAELRPHFDLVVDLPRDEVLSRLKARFEAARKTWVGHLTGSHGQLVVPESARHLWSPWLIFDATEHEAGTLLTGRFAPHPSIWTMYMALYGMVIFLMFGLGCFGLSQWMAEEPPTMLWSLPVGVVLLAALYASAFVGQGLTREQMAEMRTFMKSSFEEDQARWTTRS